MKPRLAVGAGTSAVLGLVMILSCASDASVTSAPATEAGAPPAGMDAGAPAAGGDGSAADARPPRPRAKGDPCRGRPLPKEQYFAPPGICARFVGVVPGARQLAFTPNGDLFVGSAAAIWLLRDRNDDGFYDPDEVHEWARLDGSGTGNNAHLDVASGQVYAAVPGAVRRFGYAPDALVAASSEEVVQGTPTLTGHTRSAVHVWDGWLYVGSGSAENASHEDGPGQATYDTKRSLVRRFELAKLPSGRPFRWDEGEAFTVGLRNPNGFSRNETTKRIYAVVNGIDAQGYAGADVHEDNPGEQLVELGAGRRYGYPFCFTASRVVVRGALVPPGTQLSNPNYSGNLQDDAWCAANSERPQTFLEAHTAPLDLAFFDEQPEGALPERWRGGAFVALHGSAYRTEPNGRAIVWQPFRPDGTAEAPTEGATATRFPQEVVFGGRQGSDPKPGFWEWSADGKGETPRFAGVAVSPVDGALYVASDFAAYLYRLGIEGPAP